MTRSRITSWISLRCCSTAFSDSICLSWVTRSRSICSIMRSRSTRSISTPSVRSLLRWATSTWRCLFSSAMAISSSAAMRAMFGFPALFLGDLRGLRLFAGTDGFDLALLAGFGFLQLALQFENRLAGLDVLLLDDLFLVALDLVGKLRLLGGEFGDLLDALGVEDVVGIEHFDRRLFEIIDGRVVEHVAVEVGADDA